MKYAEDKKQEIVMVAKNNYKAILFFSILSIASIYMLISYTLFSTPDWSFILPFGIRISPKIGALWINIFCHALLGVLIYLRATCTYYFCADRYFYSNNKHEIGFLYENIYLLNFAYGLYSDGFNCAVCFSTYIDTEKISPKTLSHCSFKMPEINIPEDKWFTFLVLNTPLETKISDITLDKINMTRESVMGIKRNNPNLPKLNIPDEYRNFWNNEVSWEDVKYHAIRADHIVEDLEALKLKLAQKS